ncbi:MAG: DNA topoisomerase 3 [Clostridiales bacterium]|nr:DNA topoisomerase 3 [Clostridiales bacterium]
MILVVAEKPSVGRDLARVLGCKTRGEGFLRGDTHIVTWAIGHLVTLVEPDELDERYKKWRVEDLPILPEVLPTKVIAKTRSQFSCIKKLMKEKEVERIICATDAGREGELIFGLIYEKAGCSKPVDRLWISSMTDAAIREGFASLKPRSQYMGLYNSAVCRSQADWLVGMNASRAYTLAYNALLSVGRVQTPTLAVLVQRALEIRNFKPEEYYTLTADFGDYQGQWFDPTIKEEKLNVRLPDKATAQAVAAKVAKQQAMVESVTQEEKREPAPQLFDLTSLQRDANKLLGFTADKTLKTAQSLYEKWKAITYPRTDSRYLPRDMVGRVYKAMEGLEAQYGPQLLVIQRTQEGKLPFSKRVYDDAKVSDHHAVIPTPQAVDPAKLAPDERRLFDMIVKRFIAAFCPPHLYLATRVVTVCQGEWFKTTGRSVLDMGWKQVYQGEEKKPEEEAEQQHLPPIKQHDVRTVQRTSVKKEATKPPAPHTEASLLYAMETAGREIEDEVLREQMKGAGLGTPATRAAIIERLIKVGYVARRGRVLQATEKGEKLIQVVPPEIASPEMTAKWEQALEEIAQGKRDTERFMQGIRRLSAFLVTNAQNVRQEVVFEREIRGKGGRVRAVSTAAVLPQVQCPLCGKGVQDNSKAFGCTDWKTGCKLTLWKDALIRAGGPRLTAALVTRLLQQGSLEGSTGTLSLSDGRMTFTRKGEVQPVYNQPIAYEKAVREDKKAPSSGTRRRKG